MTAIADTPKPAYATQAIPCSHLFIHDLRRASQEYCREVSRLRITPGAGEIIAYNTERGIAYRFDCTEREGNLQYSLRDILIGLGFFKHNDVPSEYIDDTTSPTISFSISKPRHRNTRHTSLQV